MRKESILSVSILLLLITILLIPLDVRGETKEVTGIWAVSDGGGVEAGGHVTILGLPSTVIFGETYAVNFAFRVEWFDWGSSIKPQNVHWFARAGCLQEESTPLGTFCTRNTQNITLDNSSVSGSYKEGDTFNITAFWNLADKPSSATGTASARLGLKMAALVECHDSAKCSPVGQGNPAQMFSYISPESSTSFIVVSSELAPAIPGPYGLTGIGVAIALGSLVVMLFSARHITGARLIRRTSTLGPGIMVSGLNLSETASLIYVYLQSRSGNSVRLRDIQRAMRFSSPSSALFHLEKLERAGLVHKDPLGNYRVKTRVRTSLTRNFTFIGNMLIPRHLPYATATSIAAILYLILLRQLLSSPISLVPLLLILGSAGAFWYESWQDWKAKPRFSNA